MIFSCVIVLVVICDQVTKHLILQSFALHDSMELISGFFYLTYVRNTGAAFGIFSGQPDLWRQIFFISVAVIALIVIITLYRVYGKESGLYRLGLGLIAGGAIGNLIDRIRFGSVTDFLDFYIFSYNYPVFNVADSAITVGVGFLLVYTLFFEDREKSQMKLN